MKHYFDFKLPPTIDSKITSLLRESARIFLPSPDARNDAPKTFTIPDLANISLRRRGDARPYEALRREAGRLGIRRALIVAASLRHLNGAPPAALDAGLALAGAGIEVDFLTFDLAPAVAAIVAERGLRCFDLTSKLEELHGAAYDLVWGQHWPAYAFAFLELDILAKYFALISHSSYEPLETVSVLAAEADVIVFDAAATRVETLAALGSTMHTPTMVTRSALSPDWFTTPATPFSKDIIPRTVAVVADHVPEEVREAVPLIARHHIDVRFIGLQDEVQPIDIDFIDRFDLILASGHVVQKALARGRPVYCYDRFGGNGYIHEANLDAAEGENFSGRSHPVRRTAEELRTEIIGGYHRAAIMCDAMRLEAFKRYRLDLALADALDPIGEVEQPRAFRRALLSPERKLARHAVNALVEYDLFTAESALLADDAGSLVRLQREAMPSDDIAFFREVSERNPAVFALAPAPRRIMVYGYLLAADGREISAIDALHDNGLVIAGTLKIASPWLKGKFPDHPGSENGRFSIALALGPDVHRAELVATLSDGRRVPFFAMTFERIRNGDRLAAEAVPEVAPEEPRPVVPAPAPPRRARPLARRLTDKLAVAGMRASSIVAGVVGSRDPHGTQDGNPVRRRIPPKPGLPPQL